MTVAEVAAALECSPGLVYGLIRAGRLAHRRVGLGRGAIRVDRADLDAYVASTRVEARPAGREAAARPRPYAGPRAIEGHGL